MCSDANLQTTRKLATIRRVLELSPIEGALKSQSMAATAMEELMKQGRIDSGQVERNMAMHSMVARLAARYGAPLGGSTLFDQLAELVEAVLERGEVKDAN